MRISTVNRLALLICSGSLAFVSQAREWRPSPELLNAVRLVESSNGINRVGDNGESLGDFQLSEGAWLDVNVWRRARALKTYAYEGTVFHPFVSRSYASNYLTILHAELNRKLRRNPSHGELYAAYNLGLASFAQCDFKIHRLNPVTRARCEQIELMLGNRATS